VEEYDFGFIQPPTNGKGVKITVNKFRSQWYVHIREYMYDGDTDIWFPTKKGIAIPSEYIDVTTFILSDVGQLLTHIYYRDLNMLLPEKQLELFEDNDET
jgi:hypothetical protein